MSSSAPNLILGNDGHWELLANDDRVLLRTRDIPLMGNGDDDTTRVSSWIVLSNAVLNGGQKTVFVDHDDFTSDNKSDVSTGRLQILNHKVPADYDGVSPNPRQRLSELIDKEQKDQGTTNKDDQKNVSALTVGLMTAASMKTLRVSTSSATAGSDTNAQTIFVDAIVTAGISNSRAAGADADVLVLGESMDDKYCDPTEDTPCNRPSTNSTTQSSSPQPPGTINTVILTNIALDDRTALLEAYAVAVEAKCRAMADLGIRCAKNPNHLSTGTGTDSAVLVCPSNHQSQHGSPALHATYAGKHTIVGELIGQAVYQATTKAVLTNLDKTYEKYPLFILSPVGWYRLHYIFLRLQHAIQLGHRPLVPSQPMEPVPRPSGMTLLIGLAGLLAAYAVHCCFEDENGLMPPLWALPRPSVSVLIAACVADTYLGSIFMPLAIHPVVLVGQVITVFLQWIPESNFGDKRPLWGFLSGFLLFSATILFTLAFAWSILSLPAYLALTSGKLDFLLEAKEESCVVATYRAKVVLRQFAHFSAWFLQVFLVRGSLSLQLLCSIALQMARFLERGQLQTARQLLSWLCSRDPSPLQAHELAGATLESLAENLSDSLTSPLFYYVLFGPLGAFAFRVANTLDSRVGYRGRMEWVGKCSARVDDVLNLLPARITAVALIGTSNLWNLLGNKKYANVKASFRIAWRDAWKCESPNAGWPMAAMAGLLDVRLDKRECYSLNGPISRQIGEAASGGGRAPGPNDICKGVALARTVGLQLFVAAMLTTCFFPGTFFGTVKFTL